MSAAASNDRLGPWLALPLGVAAAVLALIWIVGRQSGVALGFPLDDAWIHMVYGRGLATGGELAFNPGTPSTGTTSPAWAVVLAAVHLALGGVSVDALVAGVLAAGMAFHLATVGLATDAGLRWSGRRSTALAAGLVVALATPLAAAAFAGMEVTLCAALLTAGLRALALRQPWRTGLWLGLAVAARPEAAVVVVVAALAPLFAGARPLRERLGAVLRTVTAPALVAVLWFARNLAASGRPFPVTYTFKEARSLAALPDRIVTGVTELLAQVPPFVGLIGWLALLGLLVRGHGRRPWAPLLSGLGFLVANLYVIHPEDPPAFYHLRYVLPAVAPLALALALAARRLGTPLPARLRALPTLGLVAISAIGAALTLGPVSARLHNDVRNIYEVQRAMGEWLAVHVPAEHWIAASDAGAVRYFSGRPTVDVMGLNTPEFFWERDDFVRRHPVAALALMSAWFGPLDAGTLTTAAEMRTADYTVTSFQDMAVQRILTCPRQGPEGPRRVRFGGLVPFELDFLPGAVAE